MCMLAEQSYIHAHHSIGEVPFQHTTAIRVKYVSYFEKCFQKMFKSRSVVCSVTRDSKSYFVPSLATPFPITRRRNSSLWRGVRPSRASVKDLKVRGKASVAARSRKRWLLFFPCSERYIMFLGGSRRWSRKIELFFPFRWVSRQYPRVG